MVVYGAIGDWLKRWEALGVLRLDDPRAAAVQFVLLCQGDLVVRAQLGILHRPSTAEVRTTAPRRQLEGVVHHRLPVSRKLHRANPPWQALSMSIRHLALLASLLASLLVALAAPAARAEEATAAPAPGQAPSAAGPTPLAPGAPRLTLDLQTHAVITGAELALIGLSLGFKDQLVAPTCRWCEPPRFDRWARGQLRWDDTRPASTASDVVQLLIPAGAAATLWMQAAPHGQREVVEDLLLLAESASSAMLLTQGAKYAVARLRPDAWARGTIESPDDKLSFWSGHTAFAFGTAAAATQIARLRGRSGWKWMAAATFSAAALTGYLRVAADRHWLTDVATGALIGTATGLAIPLLVFQPADGRKPAVTLAPAPGGLAVIF